MRERIEIGIGHRGVIDDPLPDADVPVGIGILQKTVADDEEKKIGTCANAQRQQDRRHAAGGHAIGDGERHQGFFSCKGGIDPRLDRNGRKTWWYLGECSTPS